MALSISSRTLENKIVNNPANAPDVASVFSRSIESLHSCTTRDAVRAWLTGASALPSGRIEIMWGILKRVDGNWSADWLQAPNAMYLSNLVSDAVRLERIVRFAAANGGFALVTLPMTARAADGSALPAAPRVGVAWTAETSKDNGYLFLMHAGQGLSDEARKMASLVLPHLYWVTRSLVMRERQARRDSASVNLTKRERELLREVVRGRPDREIAEKSGRSHHTIKNQVRAILRKLGVTRRTQAAFVAERNHLIDTKIDLNTRWPTRFGD